MQEVHKQMHNNLVQAAAKYKTSGDKRRRHIELEVGDYVWAVLTKNYFSVGDYNKLAKKIGSMEIVEKINPNAYRLKLPSHIRITNVFNVKYLIPMLVIHLLEMMMRQIRGRIFSTLEGMMQSRRG